MEIDIAPIQKGKTTRAVQWVIAGRTSPDKPNSGNNRVLVVFSEEEKKRLMKLYGLGYQEIETYRTILDGYHLPALRKKKLYIDNADLVLQRIFPTAIKGLSMTCTPDMIVVKSEKKAIELSNQRIKPEKW